MSNITAVAAMASTFQANPSMAMNLPAPSNTAIVLNPAMRVPRTGAEKARMESPTAEVPVALVVLVLVAGAAGAVAFIVLLLRCARAWRGRR